MALDRYGVHPKLTLQFALNLAHKRYKLLPSHWQGKRKETSLSLKIIYFYIKKWKFSIKLCTGYAHAVFFCLCT